MGPDLAAIGEQGRALAIDHVVVVTLGDVDVEAAFELEQLAFGHRGNRAGKALDDLEVAVLDDDRRRARVEEVAREHGPAVAPDRAGRRATAAHLGEVDDVVVDEGRRVEQLERGGELDPTRTRITTELGGQQHERRAQTLAPRREHVGAEQPDQLGLRPDLIAHRGLDQLEVGRDAREGIGDAVSQIRAVRVGARARGRERGLRSAQRIVGRRVGRGG
jgi:hypothetical protein